MARIIALALVSGLIWWLWRRAQSKLNQNSTSAPTQTQRLSQCPRCDAMLPSNADAQQEIGRSCEQGERCPLKKAP